MNLLIQNNVPVFPPENRVLLIRGGAMLIPLVFTFGIRMVLNKNQVFHLIFREIGLKIKLFKQKL